MKALFSFLLACLLILGITLPVLAAPKERPDYVTAAEVQQMINAAVAPLQTAITELQNRVTTLEGQQPPPAPAEPPIDFFIENIQIWQPPETANGTWGIGVSINSSITDTTIYPCQNYQVEGISCWGIAYSPSTKLFSTDIGTQHIMIGTYSMELSWTELPAETLPSPGTSIPIEVHVFYAGKSWHLETILTMPEPTTERPTYTSPPSVIFHGNYGNSSYPCYISDETGSDLFDGIYGKYEWLKQATVQSDADYLARYDDQMGYGIPWVSRDSGRYELATFDMKEVTTLTQLGLHCYYRTPDICPPNIIEIESSQNGTDFEPVVSRGPFDWGMYADDKTHDIVVNNFTSTARYFRIYVTMNPPYALFIDEISINGKNGGSY